MKHLVPDYIYTPQGLQSNMVVSITDDGRIASITPQGETNLPYTGRFFTESALERAGEGTAGDHKGPPFPTPPPSPACWINPHSTTDDDASKKPTCVSAAPALTREEITTSPSWGND